MTEAEKILTEIGNWCPDCLAIRPLDWNFCDQCGLALPACCVDSEQPQTCFNDDQLYADLAEREVISEVLKESPLYNKMIIIPCKNGKRLSVKKRLIDLLVRRNGDLFEAVSPRVFELLNGHAPCREIVINHHVIGTNDNEGKVDIYTACDELYSELKYRSCQDMLNEVEQVVAMRRSIK